MNWMDPKDKTGERRARDVQSRQQPPDKQRVCSLQKNVNDVISGCVLTKQMMFDPEYGGGKREVIRCSSPGPNFRQARKTLQQRVAGYQEKIVPNKIPAKGGQVNQGNGDDDYCNEGHWLPKREFPTSDLWMLLVLATP